MAANNRNKKRPSQPGRPSNKNRNKRRKKIFGLGAISIPETKSPSKMTHTELLGVAGSFVAGVLLTQAIGNNIFSGGTGLALGVGGGYKKNLYLASLGVGMLVTTTVSSAAQNMNGIPDDEVNGLNLKNFTNGAQQRIGAFFSSFKDKFKLPKKAEDTPTTTNTQDTTTNGLGDVYKAQLKQPDLSELDKIEKQLDNMNGLFGDDLPNREF